MIYAVNEQTKEHRVAGKTLKDAACVRFPNERLVKAGADGWIVWNGEKCPLPNNCMVETIDRYGRYSGESNGRAKKACEIDWRKHCCSHEIVAYRPIIEPQSEQAKEWDGESWPPPIGALVESFSSNGKGVECEVLAVRGDKVIACATDTHAAGWIVEEDTRPIRTPRERWVDEAMKAADCQDSAPLIRSYFETIYDALVSGDLPIPEVKK